jgi:hypothetical protein
MRGQAQGEPAELGFISGLRQVADRRGPHVNQKPRPPSNDVLIEYTAPKRVSTSKGVANVVEVCLVDVLRSPRP